MGQFVNIHQQDPHVSSGSGIDERDIGDCIGIDATEGDASLRAFRAVLQTAKPHISVEAAVENFLNCRGNEKDPVRLGLVGHGSTGDIIAGGGAEYYPGEYIGVDNVDEWRKSLESIQSAVASITLLSCDSGRGEAGYSLLCNLAKITRASTVRARTGFTSLDDRKIWFEPGSVWRVVKSGSDALDGCEDVSEKESDAVVDLEVFGFQSVLESRPDLEGVQSLQFFDLQSENPEPRIISGTDARRLLGLIGFHKPFRMPGEPLAIPTARIVARMESHMWTSVVFNNRIARDVERPGTHYYLHPELESLFAEWNFVPSTKHR